MLFFNVMHCDTSFNVTQAIDVLTARHIQWSSKQETNEFIVNYSIATIYFDMIVLMWLCHFHCAFCFAHILMAI